MATMATWTVIALLGALAIVALWPRSFPQNHPKAYTDKKYSYPSYGMLAFFPAALLVVGFILPHIPTLVLIVFWTVWAIDLLVVTFFAKGDGFWGTLMANSATFALVVLFGVLASVPVHSTTSTASGNIGGSQALAAAPAGTGTAPATCKPQFTQQWDPNKGYRLASDGLWDNPQTQTASPTGASNRQVTLIGHDARYLAESAWSLGMHDDPNDTGSLLDPKKDCLSTQGVTLYNQVVQKWSTMKASIGQAPAGGINTGDENGHFVVSSNPGITGNLTALVRTAPDGKRTYAMLRCGNFVLPHAPSGVPRGNVNTPSPTPSHPTTPVTTPPVTTPPTTPPTTTPPTTTPPTTTPPTTTPPTTTPPTTTPPTTPTCPPGQVPSPSGCLQTKGPGPVPSGVPTNPPPSGPPETTPPVETNPANPSTTPGSEPTGVTAPGASQGPTAPVTQPPVTGAPPSSSPGTGIPDPDASTAAASHTSGNTAMGALALPLIGGGWIFKRRRRS